MPINVSDFQKQFMQNLEDYTEEVLDAMSESAKKNARLGAKELRKTGPIASGSYRKGWTATKVEGGYVIRNSKRYYLTHLLEHGHATADGTKRIGPDPHIKSVEEKVIKKYMNDVIEVISR